MMPESTISMTVMRRVRTIHALRLFAPVASGLFVFLVALWGIGREVWVAKVFENMPALSDVPAVLGFYANAFMATELPVQSLLILALAALFWLSSSIARTLRLGDIRLA